MTATKIQWRVQVRKSRAHVWKNKGLFETRERAREQGVYEREGRWSNGAPIPGTGYGFGNTRVQRYVRGEK